jgi:nitroreductase
VIKIKKIIKGILFSNKIIANIFYIKHYGNNVSNDLLLSRIQQIGHRFDHCLMKRNKVAKQDIYEIECLLNIAKNRELKFEDNLMWALGLYAMAKLNASNCYIIKSRENKNDLNASVISNLIMERRSIRKWTNEEISTEIIKKLVNTSLWSPSSCNRQPVRIIILEDEQKEFIKNYFPGIFWHNASVQLLILCNRSAYSAIDVFFPYLDGGAFIQNMLLLLHETGLGACWLGFKKWNTKDEIFCDIKEVDDFYKYFGIDKNLIPISMIVAGKYELVPKAPPRQSLDTVLVGGTK